MSDEQIDAVRAGAAVGVKRQPQWGYVGIADDIRAQIRDGRLRPGDRLPSRRLMAERYGVSEATVANALRILEAAGNTVGRQGQAVFVARTDE